MVLESNRDLVLRRLVECLSRDRTKHQVAEVTSLGLVQMTRKKLGLGLLETFSEPCEHCAGRGIIVHHDPVNKHRQQQQSPQPEQSSNRRGRGKGGAQQQAVQAPVAAAPKNGASSGTHAITEDVRHALAQIAASTVVVNPETSTSAAVSPIAPVVAAEASAAPVVTATVDKATTDVGAMTVEILDIPVVKGTRNQRRISTHDAEQILDSVLDALPEPKQPGQGRGRISRRAGSAGAVVSAPVSDD
jgi:ribonuclease E